MIAGKGTNNGVDMYRSQQMPTTQSQAMYYQNPHTFRVLADMKKQYDARQNNSDFPRSLENFYNHHDQGGAEVRVEDFKAGWSLGGVVLGPSQMSAMKGAYGTDSKTIRYGELLADLDGLPANQAHSIVMSTKMGLSTSKYLGHTARDAAPFNNTQMMKSRPLNSPGSTIMRTSQGVPITPANIISPGSPSYNVTSVTNSSVTQRAMSMQPRSAASTLSRINQVAESSPGLAESLASFDPQNTGSVTLDAFLTACARAELTLKPDELDALRSSGAVRRPYAASPELVDYASFLKFMMS